MKICLVCGREIEPRKKWEKNWEQIKYCSDKCRKNKKSSNYEEDILRLLHKRGAEKTICPSEVLTHEDKKNRLLMEAVRSSARLLVAEGKIVITQNGHIVDPSKAKGAIRLKLVRKD